MKRQYKQGCRDKFELFIKFNVKQSSSCKSLHWQCLSTQAGKTDLWWPQLEMHTVVSLSAVTWPALTLYEIIWTLCFFRLLNLFCQTLFILLFYDLSLPGQENNNHLIESGVIHTEQLCFSISLFFSLQNCLIFERATTNWSSEWFRWEIQTSLTIISWAAAMALLLHYGGGLLGVVFPLS